MGKLRIKLRKEKNSSKPAAKKVGAKKIAKK